MTKAKRPAKTLPLWQHHLRSHDYAPATVQRYGGAVRRFLAWFAEQERRSITFDDLTPIALMSYRQATQQRAATSTTNLHVVALRLWCSWLTDENYLVENPAMRLKTVGHVEPTHRFRCQTTPSMPYCELPSAVATASATTRSAKRYCRQAFD